MIEKIFRKQTRKTSKHKKSQNYLNKSVKQLYDLCNEGIFLYKRNTLNNTLKTAVNQLCNLHKEERMKGTNAVTFINKMEQHFIKNNQNPLDIINWCLNNQINPIIQSILADCYYCGKWTVKDYQKTFEFDKKSAEGGYIVAYSCLGFCYVNGIGTDIDYSKSFECYKKAAEKGLISGYYNYAYCYEYGRGVGKDEKKAFELYKQSAEQGYMYAYNSLGLCYEMGKGTEVDQKKAFECYQKAAERGLDVGQYNLALSYQYGHGTKIDKKKSF